MTEPTRTSTGIAYLTYDATLNTDASMIIQQKLDLSGNTTAQTFCENAFDLAAGEDISGALLADSDITNTNTNNLVYLGSNDVNVQKTFLNNKLNSSIAQNIACNAYEMTLGKNNQIPLVSNLKELNIVTSIVHSKYAVAALKTDGSVITWGRSDYGGDISDISNNLKDGVSAIYCNNWAFAALKTDGSVITWGSEDPFGNPISAPSGLTNGVVSIVSSDEAFAALKDNGSVVTWGLASSGGGSGVTTGYGNNTIIQDLSSSLSSNVSHIFSQRGFGPGASMCALKNDGSIVTWGNQDYGGGESATDITSKIYNNNYGWACVKTDGSVIYFGDTDYGSGTHHTDLPTSLSSPNSDVSTIYTTSGAFAALKTDGSVITWGNNEHGGNKTINSSWPDYTGPSVDASLNSGVSVIYSAALAFAAVKTDGSVVTWGNSTRGGDSSSVNFTGGVSLIASTYYAFAALKNDGSVVCWGDSNYGGNGNYTTITGGGVVSLRSNERCFAALKDDGSVVAWGGNQSYGGNINLGSGYPTTSSLTSGVVSIYPTPSSSSYKIYGLDCFAALKDDGSVVTWGNQDNGGDSSSVSDQLNP